MAVVGWMGAGVEVVVGRHAGQSQGVSRVSGDAGAFSECELNTLITPDRATIQVRSSGQDQAGIGRSSWKGVERDATRRLWFFVHAAGWLHSMELLESQYSIPNAAVKDLHSTISMCEKDDPNASSIVAGDFNEASMVSTMPEYKQYVTCLSRNNRILYRCYCQVKKADRSVTRSCYGDANHATIMLIPIYKQQLKRLSCEYMVA